MPPPPSGLLTIPWVRTLDKARAGAACLHSRAHPRLWDHRWLGLNGGWLQEPVCSESLVPTVHYLVSPSTHGLVHWPADVSVMVTGLARWPLRIQLSAGMLSVAPRWLLPWGPCRSGRAPKRRGESCWAFSGGGPTLSCRPGQVQGQGTARGRAYQEAGSWGALEDVRYNGLRS